MRDWRGQHHRHVPCSTRRITHSPSTDRVGTPEASVDVVVIGGGPSGAVVARLLASWGHSVRLLTRPTDPARTLANSLPPSTHKLLAQTGVLELVDRVGYRTTGNTVWWGDRDGDVEPFSADGTAWGYQIDRARLDPLLLDAATVAGVDVLPDARVTHVELRDGAASLKYESGGQSHACATRIVLDCSGRSGVIAVAQRLRRHVQGGRMQALVGVWERDTGWFLENPTHTFIETCDEGWAWSLPTSETTRHVGIMVDGATSRLTRGPSLEATYRAQLALTPRVDRQVHGARLSRVFACDSTVYGSHAQAGPGYALVGDASSTLNPLSSFGVKKALASAWLAAIVTNTCLRHPGRAEDARRFFATWESQVWHINLKRSRDFAVEALDRHRSAFWSAQAAAAVDDAVTQASEAALLGSPDVTRAFERLRHSDRVVFSRNEERTLVSAPIVRGNLIAIEPAVPLGAPAGAVRYVRGIDLVTLATIAPLHPDIPAIYERYCAVHGVSSLPAFLAGLSVLTARDVLLVNAPAPGPVSASLS